MINDIAILLDEAGNWALEICDRRPSRRAVARSEGFLWSSSFAASYESASISVACSGRLWGRELIDAQLSLPMHFRNLPDAAYIAQLYLCAGCEIFEALEGVAVLMLDRLQGRLILFRDWIGSSTFFYCYDGNKLQAATSRKSFRKFFPDSKAVSELRAGTALSLDKKRKTTQVAQLQELPTQRSRDNIDVARSRVRHLLTEALSKRTVPGTCGLLLSGGVDSTILAYLLQQQGVPYEAFTFSLRKPLFPVGMPDFDLFAARKVAGWLGIRLHEILLAPSDLPKFARSAIYACESRRSTLVDEMCGMLPTARAIARLGISNVYSGESADMMFGSPCFVLRFVHKRQLPNLARKMVRFSVPTAVSTLQRLFWHTSQLELIFPYMYRPLVTYALSLPIPYRIDKARLMKIVLRRAFEGEIPNEFLNRGKGITRETTHVRYALERELGNSRYRYYGEFKRLFGPVATV